MEVALPAVQRTLGNQTLYHLLRARLLQARATMSQPGDSCEQEAERVADQVVRMPEPLLESAPRAAPQTQRLCPKSQEDVNRQLLEELQEFRTSQDRP